MPSEVSMSGADQVRRTSEELERELAEAREQQAATAEILRVISSSPTDVQPVFDTIARSAARLCEALDVMVLRVDGDVLRLVAHYGPMPAGDVALHLGTVGGRTVIERRVIHVRDVQTEVDEFPEGSAIGRERGQRTTLSCPLLKANMAIGNIQARRNEVRPFSDQQISLLKTFADQAVIAIENTRLFEEVQAKKRDLQQSLEHQTATSKVLEVISSSPGKLEPVFETILSNARRLCGAKFGHLFLYQDGYFRAVALHDAPPEYARFLTREPIRAGPETGLGRIASTRQIVHIPDISAESAYHVGDPLRRASVDLGGVRTFLGVPMVRGDALIGALVVYRDEVRSFTDAQVELVAGFADQAVIAIENTRLFEAEQASKRELQESLEYQTATSDVLGVISRTPTNLQPVLATICATAARLCETKDVEIFIRHSDRLRLGWVEGPIGTEAEDWPISRGLVMGRAVLNRELIQVRDLRAASDEYPEGYQSSLLVGHRTIIAVPLMRKGEAVGVLTLRRPEVKPFTDKQIALLRTFADQAVIAIENTRLFEEVQARNRDLTALGEVGRAVSSTLDLKLVLKTIAERAVELSGTHGGSIFYFREDIDRFELGETTGLTEDVIARFRKLDIAAGQTGLGEAIAAGKPLQIADITKRSSNALRDAAIEAGMRAALIVPLLSSEGPLGALVLQRRDPGEFPPQVVRLMQAFADQSAIALENARLFNEIAQKSRELEIASQHKSQFVANMSHELRTPLAAILGYAELMQEGFYEPLGQKSLDALTRIRSNGKHLLGLINTVLDIAKIESGQFTLNMTEYAIESVVETVRAATESLAQNKKLSLTTSVDKALPIGLGDEQRLTQVLLNLVGNAIKFTDTGEVRVTAKAINGHFNVSVTDTGSGIPEEHQARIFEQFHQVDSSNTKAKGGTGLGLAIAKQIVEMHGGRIWVESTVGKGSTFQMEIPARAQVARSA